MKIIFISNNAEKVRTIRLNSWAKYILSILLLGAPLAAGTMLGIKVADGRWQLLFDNSIAEMQHQIVVQKEEITAGRDQAQNSLAAMTVKLAKLRSRLVRLDALGEQLTEIADLNDGEFDFSSTPGLGGPISSPLARIAEQVEVQDKVSVMFAKLDNSITLRESQLQILKEMLSDDRSKKEQLVSGRPIKKGWMSSEYGMRIEGDDIVAVASGVVTWSGERSGYGLMVEVNHSDDFVTRYGHNSENIAEVGSVVKKGDVIARMGSSGRSTGPHVHFEVFRNGRTVDPESYIHRNIR